jgi:DnaJ-class molecular chaperone
VSSYQERKLERTLRYQAEHGRKLVRCTACNGSGEYDHNGSPPCGSCGGTGKVREDRHHASTPAASRWREALAQKTALAKARQQLS